jgi:hypothetical protein
MTVIIVVALRSTGFAADPRFADWPCMQIKVPEISVAAVWSGPPIDDVRSAWEENPAVRDLVARLAARRTALQDAQRTISDFITGTAAERQQKAKLLFAGLLARLNAERSEVMDGIERFYRQQKELAAKTRSEISELRKLQDAPNQDQTRIEDLANRLEWDTRIFDERRKTISFACEVPVLIEQRLFALARMIEQTIE